MGMNKTKGNMYPWISHTWNPIRGKCPHDCSYCYMKRIPNVGELRFVEKEMDTNLGEGNTIFVGSSTDMWAKDVKSGWILETLEHCYIYSKNQYIFQTKNPIRYFDFASSFLMGLGDKIFLGTTIETNRYWQNPGITEAPNQRERSEYLYKSKGLADVFVSIEPIMDFDLQDFVKMIEIIKPKFISIGADSGHNNLPEPPAWKVKKLIAELEKFTEVRQKDNLKRLLKE